MVARIGRVQEVSSIGQVNAHVYRNDRIPDANTDALTVYAADPDLLTTLQGHMAHGEFLSAATNRYPAVVLGAETAQTLGVDRVDGATQLWLGHHYFTVIGILKPIPLAANLDRAALVGFPIATVLLHADGSPVTMYVRTDPDNSLSVASVLAATVNPAHPAAVTVNRPSDALAARAAAKDAFQNLLLGLGAVALLVGAIGIVNVMFIAVIERRTEIGLWRALGATRFYIGIQFITESILISLLGAVVGCLVGVVTVAVYSHQRQWTTDIPPLALVVIVACAAIVGAIAGLYPALRAARLAPIDALRSA